jgi:hypothetical protein
MVPVRPPGRAAPADPISGWMRHTRYMSDDHDGHGSPSAPATASAARRTATAAAALIKSTAAAAAEPIADALDAARETIRERPGQRVRRVRRRGKQPLPALYEVHPDAVRARPIEVGVRTIDVDRIRGTAVGGGDQRGGDFLPIKEARGQNWSARWRRLQRAHEQLVDLPPIDVVKFADGYWVIDGHNRVALALYAGQVGIDASIVELVPLGARRTEPISSLEAELTDSRAIRGAVESNHAGSADDAARGDGPG